MSAAHHGRYAPSPTGYLHVGNLRTALIAWLRARSEDAAFTLRVDDLDPDRVRPGIRDEQIADLTLLGIDWDGAPVDQRPRMDRYDAAIHELIARGLAYRCFCSRADVRAAASAPHGDRFADAYPGTCSHLDPAESATRVAAGEAASVRVRAAGARWSFTDAVLGPVEGTVDDFAICRKDGVAAYNLATVVDDADLAIGEVVRGSDLAPSTPRQLWLADALGLPAPTFAHVPLVLGADGSRLAKRHGSVTRTDLLARGIDALGLRTLLLQSLGPAIDDPAAPLDHAVHSFDLAALDRHDVRIDPARFVPGGTWNDVVIRDDQTS